MKYTIKNIQDTGKPVKYLFFWGHQPSKTGEILKSCFSQWWQVNFTIDNIEYKSAEHYMMAEKARLFKDQEVLEKILECKSPAAAKKLGRQVKNFEPTLWEANSFEVVKRANYYKFAQNDDLNHFCLTQKNESWLKPVLLIPFGELAWQKIMKMPLIQKNGEAKIY